MRIDVLTGLRSHWFMFVIALFIVLAAGSASASVKPIFIPAPDRADMVHDIKRNMLYITNADQVLRYDMTSLTFAEPWKIGGNLKGIDISPDGSTLAVADLSMTDTQVWIHLIDIGTGTSQKRFMDKAIGESGTYAVAFGIDGRVYSSSDFDGSGWVPFRQIDPQSKTSVKLLDIRHRSMLSASAGGSIISFAEADISDGRFGAFNIATGTLVHRTGYDLGTGWFNYEIASNREGTQYAIPTYGGTFIYDQSLHKKTTVGNYVGEYAAGVIYHPFGSRLYLSLAETSIIRARESSTFNPAADYDIGITFRNNGNGNFDDGRLRISKDGKMLFAIVNGGVVSLLLDPSSDNTATKITASLDRTLQAGEPVTFTATVYKTDENLSGTPAGRVTFLDGSTILCTSPLSGTPPTATCTTSLFDNHSITAAYGGDGVFTPSTSFVMNREAAFFDWPQWYAQISLSSLPNPALYGGSTTFTAKVYAPWWFVTGTVTFMDGQSVLGTGVLSGGLATASFSTSALTAGTHLISAVYSGDNHYTSSTPAVLFQDVILILTVKKSGSGAGNVTASQGAITWNGRVGTAQQYDYNAIVTLTATANAGSTFAGWSGEGCSGTGTCTVTMNQLRNVVARFTRASRIGVFDHGTWYLDSNQSWAWDGAPADTLGIFGVGLTNATPVVGDWNGDGTSKIGVFTDGMWYLDMNRSWQWDGEPTDKMGIFGVGIPGAIPVVGDWTGDGITKIGVYVAGTWYLDMNNNGQWDGEPTDKMGIFGIGLTGAVPVVGDWTGTGITKIGIYMDGIWYLDMNNNWQWDEEPTDKVGIFGVGLTGVVPVVGDWNADGTTEIGIYQDGLWYLDKNRSWAWDGEPTDQFGQFGVGLTGVVPVPGMW
ncbi:MAG: Ig-like domain repeat protein [Thermodesulfovibrionales bacterium]